MKHIDKMLLMAKIIFTSLIESIYDRNDDGFIEALGADPKDYEVNVDGEVMYDSIKALSDSCENTWNAGEDNEE